MSQRLQAVWRTAAQALVGLTLAWLAARGLHLGDDVAGDLALVLYAAGVAAYAGLVHWLESRRGGSWAAVLARGLARVLVLGAAGTPVYVRQADRATARVVTSGGTFRPV